MRYKKIRGSNQYMSRYQRRHDRNHFKPRLYLVIGSVVILGVCNLPMLPHEAKASNEFIIDPSIVSPLPIAGESAEIHPSVTPAPTNAPGISQEQIDEYIKTIFGKDAPTAIAVQRAECNPANYAYPACQLKTYHENSIGIFQINIQSDYAKVHYDRIPGNTLDEKIEWLKDPKNNTLMAYWIFSKSGFTPWSGYTSGNYLKYL